ncbi:DNA sulfur modification protein DndD [Bacillus mycoides]|uniref:DNA sulfur modification protein DndD n=1 Tax=Bacillus mycoides TaxID=1405 RepID=UPI001C02DCD5|nr:DNA sulfur modification protein DndD [Bacillus mycoides]QWG26939.1 DNA sulfur modification protein DndD [Bacillus mycoides]
MIFEYIKFTNYRPYYGNQIIDLNNRNQDRSPYKKNIILIGGLNGAGKTSFINAIFVCLYGRRFFTEKIYSKMLNSAINKKFRHEGGKQSAVELCFSDESGTYIIEVQYTLDHNDRVLETRKIHLANEKFEKHKELNSSIEEFNEFIDSKIPKDVSQFFIFDAEKIRDLVGEHDSKETIKAIQKVVSLELYQQLLDDLNHQYTKEIKNADKLVKDTELESLASKLSIVTNEIDILKEDDGQEDTAINELTNQKMEVEQKRRRKIASNSLTKQEINRILGEKEGQIKQIQKGIDAFSKKSLPTIILANLIKDLQKRIQLEKEHQIAIETNQNAFKNFDQFIKGLLTMSIYPELTPSQKTSLYSNGKKVWAELNKITEQKINNHIEILHDLSPGDFNKILDLSTKSSGNLKELLDKRYSLTAEISKFKQRLLDAPDVIDTHYYDEKLKHIDSQLISLYSSRKHRNEKITRLIDQRHQLTNEYTRKQKLKTELGPIDKKLAMLQRLINATKDFIDQVTELKANSLKDEIEQILKILFRKHDLAQIEFSSQDFTLRIYDEYTNEIDLTTRSEGEKQLIALAMIWALTKVSGAKTPFVIDTPLARLDSVHRSNIVNRYFTNLSDQVIILSTDTEITADFLQELNPHLLYSYVLEHNDDEKITQIRPGYFEFGGVI